MNGFEAVFIKEEIDNPDLNVQRLYDFSTVKPKTADTVNNGSIPNLLDPLGCDMMFDTVPVPVSISHERDMLIQVPNDSIPISEVIRNEHPDVKESFAPYNELEFSEEELPDPLDIKDTFLTCKKLQMKCTVELHKGDFYGTSCCSQCRKLKGIETEMLKCKMSKESINLSFPTKFAVIQHKIKKHSRFSTSSTCQICGGRYIDRKSLLTHLVANHLGFKRFTCNLCQKHLNDKQLMIKHINKHGVLENSDNWEKFVTRGNFQYCLELGDYQTFYCDVCDEKFYTEFQLKKHLQYHNVCRVCGEDFPTKQLRYNHLRTHGANAVKDSGEKKKKSKGSWKSIKKYWAENRYKKKNIS